MSFLNFHVYRNDDPVQFNYSFIFDIYQLLYLRALAYKMYSVPSGLIQTSFSLTDNIDNLATRQVIHPPNVKESQGVDLATAIMNVVNPNGISGWNNNYFGQYCVNKGEIGVILANNEVEVVSQGSWILSPRATWVGRFSLSEPLIQYKSLKVITVEKGKYGLALDDRKAVILGEGVHVRNTKSFEHIAFVDVNQKYIQHRTIHIVNVSMNEFALVTENNVPKVLGGGQYFIDSSSFSLNNFVNTNQQYIQHQNINIIKVPKDKIVFLTEGSYRFNSSSFQFQFRDAHQQHNERPQKEPQNKDDITRLLTEKEHLFDKLKVYTAQLEQEKHNLKQQLRKLDTQLNDQKKRLEEEESKVSHLQCDLAKYSAIRSETITIGEFSREEVRAEFARYLPHFKTQVRDHLISKNLIDARSFRGKNSYKILNDALTQVVAPLLNTPLLMSQSISLCNSIYQKSGFKATEPSTLSQILDKINTNERETIKHLLDISRRVSEDPIKFLIEEGLAPTIKSWLGFDKFPLSGPLETIHSSQLKSLLLENDAILFSLLRLRICMNLVNPIAMLYIPEENEEWDRDKHEEPPSCCGEDWTVLETCYWPGLFFHDFNDNKVIISKAYVLTVDEE